MGLQSSRTTAAGEHQGQYGSTAGLRDPFAEESTDVLRRRAEHLLDEMMLGAVDAGGEQAGDYGSHANGIFAPLDAGMSGAAINGNHNPGDDRTSGDRTWAGSDYAAAPLDTNGYPTGSSGFDPLANSPSPAPSYASDRPNDGLRQPDAGERTPRLVSAADRYAEVGGGEQRPRPDALSTGSLANGAVRRQSPSTASTMTMGGRTTLRSNLLPRSNEVDVVAAQQEINELLHQVTTTLPPGHEATERSRHLLAKAQTILHSDQSRSAEIEYYLQQVRRILERTQQRAAWSDLYRSRLLLYLVSWVLLAAVVMIGMGLYREEFTQLLTTLFGLAPTTPWTVYAGMAIATACAGALGATLGVFMGIARRRRTEHGYFDRKYGLRGLLMPLIGFVFGALIGVAASVLFYFVDVTPDHSFMPMAPIVLAFLIGVGQESLYGAR